MKKSSLINVTLGGRTVCCPADTVLRTLLETDRDDEGRHYLGAVVNHAVVTLEFKLEVDSDVRLLTLAEPEGWRIYRCTASFLLGKAVRELFPDARFSLEHSLGTGFYCHFERNGASGLSAEELTAIAGRMRELVARNAPIVRHKLAFAAAVRCFEEQGQPDKVNLLRYRNPPKIVCYSCEGFTDLSHGPLASNAGAVAWFDLIPYPPGFVIQFPSRAMPPRIPPLKEQPSLFHIFQEHKRWGRIVGVSNVGQLNQAIANKEFPDIVRIAEALHEKKIAQLADRIAADRERVRWILIAGPSSSGKTTFAKRLGVQLRVNGVQTLPISVDDYFVDRAHTPPGRDGQPDFEHLEAIDLPTFHDHLRRLDEGREAEVFHFNFQRGVRVPADRTRRLAEGQVAILEGIHALNPRLTSVLPREHKFSIYISALTQLNLDSNNRISTTDNRLLRRMVRDNHFRGHSALRTLQMWPSVREGEKRWIFPFQHEADAAFNSALDYELAVLKPFAEPLLAEIKPDLPPYGEARRMQEFLESFLVARADVVPPTSILREFIGDSVFHA